MSNDANTPGAAASGGASQAEEQSTLFAHLVLQQSNMAMMLMGKMPNPQSGEKMSDLESARFFIDTLEMLEAKTKGNLTKEESGLLRQTLMTLRLGYVEAVNEAQAGAAKAEPQAPAQPQPAGAKPEPQPASATGDTGAKPASSGGDDEHRTKFSKKY